MLYLAEGQVDPRLRDARLLGDFVFEVFLGTPRHDQQAPMRQPFGKSHSTSLSLKPEEALRAQTDRRNHRTQLRLSIGMETDAVISVPMDIAQCGVVPCFREATVAPQ